LPDADFTANFVLKNSLMADLTNAQKKEIAGILYLQGNLTQQEIAEKVGVSRRTVGSWAASGKWEEMKAGLTMTREQQIMNLQRQIAEINRSILDRPKGERFATQTEAGTISKLSVAIDKLEKDAGLKDLISSATRFLVWLRGIDINKAKEFGTLWDNFIRSTL
jgi:transcriptional regulator with XRE-family HTH domain